MIDPTYFCPGCGLLRSCECLTAQHEDLLIRLAYDEGYAHGLEEQDEPPSEKYLERFCRGEPAGYFPTSYIEGYRDGAAGHPHAYEEEAPRRTTVAPDSHTNKRGPALLREPGLFHAGQSGKRQRSALSLFHTNSPGGADAMYQLNLMRVAARSVVCESRPVTNGTSKEQHKLERFIREAGALYHRIEHAHHYGEQVPDALAARYRVPWRADILKVALEALAFSIAHHMPCLAVPMRCIQAPSDVTRFLDTDRIRAMRTELSLRSETTAVTVWFGAFRLGEVPPEHVVWLRELVSLGVRCLRAPGRAHTSELSLVLTHVGSALSVREIVLGNRAIHPDSEHVLSYLACGPQSAGAGTLPHARNGTK